MGTTSHWDVAKNWVAQIHGTRVSPYHLRGANVSVSSDLDRILSYHWWEMARIVRGANGDPKFWLINGDRYSPSTSQHQGNVRGAIAMSELPSIILPYSALEAAGVLHDSIEPLEIRDDRWEPVTRSAIQLPERRDPIFNASDRATLLNSQSERVEAIYTNGTWTWEDVQHSLGDSLFRASVPERRTRRALPEEIELYERNVAWEDAFREAGWPDNNTLAYSALMVQFGSVPERTNVSRELHTRDTGEWEYYVHTTVTRKPVFLSSFDYQERFPLYFLCELPRGSGATSVEQAYEVLKPELVKTAEAAEVVVSRQGDIFAIPTELTTAQVKRLTPRRKGRIVKRPHVLGTNHSPSEVLFATRDRVYARGFLYHDPGDFRAPDHARRRMGDGKTWHLLLRNTVPRTSNPDTRRSVRV